MRLRLFIEGNDGATSVSGEYSTEFGRSTRPRVASLPVLHRREESVYMGQQSTSLSRFAGPAQESWRRDQYELLLCRGESTSLRNRSLSAPARVQNKSEMLVKYRASESDEIKR